MWVTLYVRLILGFSISNFRLTNLLYFKRRAMFVFGYWMKCFGVAKWYLFYYKLLLTLIWTVVCLSIGLKSKFCKLNVTQFSIFDWAEVLLNLYILGENILLFYVIELNRSGHRTSALKNMTIVLFEQFFGTTHFVNRQTRIYTFSLSYMRDI